MNVIICACFFLLCSGCLFSETIQGDQSLTSVDIIITMVREMKASIQKQHRRLVARMIKLDNTFDEIQRMVSTLATDAENKSKEMTKLYNEVDTIEDEMDIFINDTKSWCRNDELVDIQGGYGNNESDAPEGLQKSEYSSCNSHMGKEYVVMFPEGIGNPKLPQLLISSVEDTIITFESPHPGINRTVKVTSDNGVVVNFPKSIFQKGSSIENKGILLRSTSDIFVTGFPISEMNGEDKGDLYSAIPVKNLGKSYLYIGIDNSVMSVVALHDNTNLNITANGPEPPEPLSGNGIKTERYGTGYIIRVTLQRLSTFQLFGDLSLLNLHIDSDKIVGVLSGSYSDGPYRKFNSLLSYVLPLSSFGTKFIVPPVPVANFSSINIYSRMNQTNRFEISGNSYFVSGSFLDYKGQRHMKSKISYLVTTSIPSAIAQTTSILMSQISPFQSLIPSLTQYSNYYKFMTPTTATFLQYAAIMIQKTDTDGLRLDGVAIRDLAPDIHVLLDERIDYNILVLQIGAGQHEVFHIKRNVTFGVVVQGISSTQTYGFPAGLRLSDVCP